MKLLGYIIKKIGLNRGKPRLWCEGESLSRAGLEKGTRISITLDDGRRTLRIAAADCGEKVISGRERNGRQVPILDIESAETLKMFEGFDRIRVLICEGAIYVMPVASDMKAHERIERLVGRLKRGEPVQVGSVSHGGGVLSLAVHQGFNDAGIDTRLAFANEIRLELLDQSESVNPAWQTTMPLAAPMQELVTDDWAMSRLPKVDVLEAGIPCQGASLSGRAKNGIAKPEDHDEVGHLIAPFLAILSKVNPSVVIFENVPPYASTASASILRTTLRDWGYNVHEALLDGRDFNAIEARQRFCLIAVTRGLEFNAESIAKPIKKDTCLGDVLEAVPDTHSAWKDVPYLHEKQARDRAAGKGFAMQIVNQESRSVGTIGKGYAKWRSTEPLVSGNREHPNKLRLLTPREHARVKGIPEMLIHGLPATIAHELLGQSILFEPFRRVAFAIGQSLAQFCHFDVRQAA